MALGDYCRNSLVYAESKGFKISQIVCNKDEEGDYVFTFPCLSGSNRLIDCDLCPFGQDKCPFGEITYKEQLRQILMERAHIERYSDRMGGGNPRLRHILFEDDTRQIQFMCLTLHEDGGETIHASYPPAVQ